MARANYKRHDLRNTNTIVSTLGNALLDRGLTICSNAAVELVLLIDWLNSNRRDAMPEPWYTIFCKCSCRISRPHGRSLIQDAIGRSVYMRHGAVGPPALCEGCRRDKPCMGKMPESPGILRDRKPNGAAVSEIAATE